MWKTLLTQDRALSPFVLQVLGIVLIVVSVIALAFGQSWGAPVLGTGGSLLGIGEYAAAAGQMKELQKHFDRFEDQHPVSAAGAQKQEGEAS